MDNTTTYAVFYAFSDREAIQKVVGEDVEQLVVGNEVGPTHFAVLQDTPASVQLGVETRYVTSTVAGLGVEDDPLTLTDIARRIALVPIEPEEEDDGL